MSEYPTGTYVKGDDLRVANTPARAVALVFDGYVLQKTETKTDPAKVASPLAEDADLNPNRRTRKSNDDKN